MRLPVFDVTEGLSKAFTMEGEGKRVHHGGPMQPAREPIDPFIGTTVASELRPGVVYRIERTLGEGGTACAYLASRFGPEGTSPVVMKVIKPSIIAQAGDKARMVVQKEAVALGRINERIPPCPFVVRLLDTGSIDYPGRSGLAPLPWLALEYVHGGPDGATLEERVKKCVTDTGSAFTPERTILLLDQLTEGLGEIHAAGVIHRDLNPNNVLCCGTGSSEMFKISDFGIARPVGMNATFGAGTLGTPGYIAPEQLGDNDEKTEFRADIFSLGALVFYALTGEDLFQAPNFMGMVAVRHRERRSIRKAPALAPEIMADVEISSAIDRAIALATANDPELRPKSPKAFAASFKPWLTSCPPTRRTAIPLPAIEQTPLSGWTFTVRHPAEQRWVLMQLGWDSDGHCLANTTDGLAYFDGTRWSEVPHHSLGGIRPVRFVSSAGTGRWLIGGDGAVMAEYSRAGVTRLLRGDDPALTLADASGDLADLAVAIATRPASPPLLCAISGGRWLKPLPVPNATTLTTLSRLDDTRWLVGGRGTDGRGFAGIYAPLRWEIDALPSAETRAWLSSASRPERDVSILVGSHGAVLRRERGEAAVGYIQAPVDLASAAIDVLGRAWAGGAGELWMASGSESGWYRLWSNPEWRAPFVSIFADAGFVFAATAEGAILEGRATGMDRISGLAPKR
jgi:serine/threonine protein kinase